MDGKEEITLTRSPDELLAPILAAHQIKITRIVRVTRLMDKLGELDREIIKFIQSISGMDEKQASNLLSWAQRHDTLRDEIVEATDEAVAAETEVVKTYRDLVNEIWRTDEGKR